MFKPGEIIKSKERKPVLDQGRHSRARLGFILMSTDLAAESDFFDIAPKDVAIHITRLKTDDYTTNETLAKHIEFMADAASRIVLGASLLMKQWSIPSTKLRLSSRLIVDARAGGALMRGFSIGCRPAPCFRRCRA